MWQIFPILHYLEYFVSSVHPFIVSVVLLYRAGKTTHNIAVISRISQGWLQIFLYNTNILIQHIYFHTTQIFSFKIIFSYNKNIFIQHKYFPRMVLNISGVIFLLISSYFNPCITWYWYIKWIESSPEFNDSSWFP